MATQEYFGTHLVGVFFIENFNKNKKDIRLKIYIDNKKCYFETVEYDAHHIVFDRNLTSEKYVPISYFEKNYINAEFDY